MEFVEIWFYDLKEEKQKELMELWGIDEVRENIYITQIDF